MSDPLAVTAREMIAAAEQERDLALGQVRALENKLARESELREAFAQEAAAFPTLDDKWRALAKAIVMEARRHIWREYEDGPDDLDLVELVAHRLRTVSEVNQ